MAEQGGVITFPAPAYQNVPITPQYYEPSRFVISGVTLGQTTTVTTSEDHNYVVGQEVRLLIPASFGCFQLNNLQGFVLSIPAANQVVISINSAQNVNQFIAATSTIQEPQIVAIGDINQGYTSLTGTNVSMINIPGSFINIS